MLYIAIGGCDTGTHLEYLVRTRSYIDYDETKHDVRYCVCLQ